MSMSIERLAGAIRDNYVAVIQPPAGESHKLYEMAHAIAQAVIAEITTHAVVSGTGLTAPSNGGAVSGVTLPGGVS